MYSKQAQFEKETIERLYGFVDQDYKLYDPTGRNAKPDIISMVMLSKQGGSQTDPVFSALLELMSDYAAINPENPATYGKEEELLKAIVQLNDQYVEAIDKHLNDLLRKSNRLFNNNSGEKQNNPETRKKDLQYVIAQTNATNKYGMAACLKLYFDKLMYGHLSPQLCPDAKERPNSGYIASEVPLFIHSPISQDIPQSKTGSFYDGLRTLAESDPAFITDMLRDCNNGKTFVRIFNADAGYTPEYIEVDKAEAYFNWNILQGGKCNWPGYIITALQNKNIDLNSEPRKLFSYILGDKINETDIDDFCRFSNDRIVIPGNTAEDKVLAAYKNCGLALYASLVLTNSNMFEDSEQYIEMNDALLEFISCFSLSGADKQARDAAMELLKQYSDRFRSKTALGSKRAQKRFSVCDAIDTLYEIYSTKPAENPQKTILKLYPQFFGKA